MSPADMAARIAELERQLAEAREAGRELLDALGRISRLRVKGPHASAEDGFQHAMDELHEARRIARAAYDSHRKLFED